MFDQEVMCRTEDELGEKIAEWEEMVLSLRLPVTIGAGLDISKDVATLMAHCYKGFDTKRCTHSLLVRSTKLGSETIFNQSDIARNKILDAGIPMSVQDGTYITHLFHRGRHPRAPGTKWISFGVRMSDEEAIKILLTDGVSGSGVQLMAIDGPYCRNHHP